MTNSTGAKMNPGKCIPTDQLNVSAAGSAQAGVADWMTNDSTGWFRGAVIYQVYPRSFQDSNGDGIGDLEGLRRRIPYIADLGVDAIWVSPFFTSPMFDMGYDISDFTDVDPVFGDLGDFDAVVRDARAHGLKVLIDQIAANGSTRHPAFQASRSSRDNAFSDWFVWADAQPDGSPPNNWLSYFGGPAWTWDARRRQYYLHKFHVEQPSFNFHHVEVCEWHLENIRFWLERGIDGVRLDAINYCFHDLELRDNPPTGAPAGSEASPYDLQSHRFDKSRPEVSGFLTRVRQLLDEYGAVSVGEIGDFERGTELMSEYSKPGHLHSCYTFDLLRCEYTADEIRTVIEGIGRHAPDVWPTWSFSNHDVPRHPGRWARTPSDVQAVARRERGTPAHHRWNRLRLPGRGTGPCRYRTRSR